VIGGPGPILLSAEIIDEDIGPFFGHGDGNLPPLAPPRPGDDGTFSF